MDFNEGDLIENKWIYGKFPKYYNMLCKLGWIF